MKRMVVIILAVVLLGCSGKGTTQNMELKESLSKLSFGEYIDIDNDTAKIFFHAPHNIEIILNYGESADKIDKEITLKNTDGSVYIDGLKDGQKYYYTVSVRENGQIFTGNKYSFVKKDIEAIKKYAEWARTSVFYEIFVRSFYDTDGNGIGDFKGIAEKTDYLKKLGIGAVWLMPINASPSYHGYDVEDYYSVNSEYGTMKDFENMVAELHKNGIRVIIDLVVNHTSSKNKWFAEASKSEENKYRNYYIWEDSYTDLSEKGEWGQELWNSGTGGTYYAVFWSGMPDLNFKNQTVREEMKKAAKFWLDKGVDGFRLDASKHIDTDSEVTHSWWKEFSTYVKSVNKDAYIVGENWDNNPQKTAPFLQEFDSTFNFGLSDAMINASATEGKGKNLAEEINEIRKTYDEWAEGYIDAVFLKNHDMPRIASELKGDKEKLKLAAAMLLTVPGTPYIYYGEEIGMTGQKPDENIREPFEWYKSGKGEGMPFWRQTQIESGDGISLEEQENSKESLFNYYKKLVYIRNSNKVIFTGSIKMLKYEKGIMGYILEDKNAKIEVYHNITSGKRQITLDKEMTDQISGVKGNKFLLKPYESVILI